MADYSRLGYNDRLINQNSPLVQPSFQDAYNFTSRLVDTGVDVLGANAVKQDSISQNAVQGSHIAAGAVDSADIAGSAIMGTHIESTQVDSIHFVGSAVDGTHIANGAVDSIHITGSAIDGTHYQFLDLPKGTGIINTTTGTFTGTVRADTAFSANGTLGISETVPVEQAGGTINLIFTNGLFAGTS